MDKKTLIMVGFLTITFFLVNNYFQKDYEKELENWKAQEMQRQERTSREVEEQLASRTAEISELPAAIFSLDAAHTQYYGAALLQNERALLPFEGEESPAQVYAGEQVYHLVHQFDLIGQKKLALYQSAAAKESKPISLLTLPLQAKTDVQFLPRERLEGSSRWVELCQVEERKIHLLTTTPDQQRALTQGFIFLEFEGKYYPTGIYLPDEEVLISLMDVPGLSLHCQEVRSQAAALPALPSNKGEEFYLLENRYMQVVVSSKGASVTEINLPFPKTEGEEEEPFAVREIGYDREIERLHPELALFPLQPTLNSQLERVDGSVGGYYPLLRRGTYDARTQEYRRLAGNYRAFTLRSEYPELAEANYRLVEFTKDSIVFELIQPQRRIRKTYRLINSDSGPVPFCLDLEIKIEGDGRGLWITSGVPEVEWLTNSTAPIVKYRATVRDKSSVEKIDLPQQEMVVTSQRLDWICNSNGFFGILMEPVTTFPDGYRVELVPGTVAVSRLVALQEQENKFQQEALPGYQALLPVKMDHGVSRMRIYAGPMAEAPLSVADREISKMSGEPDHGFIESQEFHGWFSFVSKPIGKIFFYLMQIFNYLTHSWGIAIILLTVVLRLILFPLNRWSIRSNERMKAVAPKIAAIQAKYKDNPKQGQVEVLQLYQKEKVNPFGGCFPILLQLPFLFTMFDLLKSTFELRGATFIPGWIDDLAAPDVVFEWSSPLYFVGSQFHLLPFLVGIGMWFQQKTSSPLPEDKSMWTDQQRQQHNVMNIMTLVFSVMCYHFPSGLNLYWISSMALGIVQQWWFKRAAAQRALQI